MDEMWKESVFVWERESFGGGGASVYGHPYEYSIGKGGSHGSELSPSLPLSLPFRSYPRTMATDTSLDHSDSNYGKNKATILSCHSSTANWLLMCRDILLALFHIILTNQQPHYPLLNQEESVHKEDAQFRRGTLKLLRIIKTTTTDRLHLLRLRKAFFEEGNCAAKITLIYFQTEFSSKLKAAFNSNQKLTLL
jgi:hypothetical protein